MAFRNEQGIQPPPIRNYGHLMGMLEHFWTTIRENIDLIQHDSTKKLCGKHMPK